jgi:hypothetical protein
MYLSFEWKVLLKYLDNKLIYLFEEQKSLERTIGRDKFIKYMYEGDKKIFGKLKKSL